MFSSKTTLGVVLVKAIFSCHNSKILHRCFVFRVYTDNYDKSYEKISL